MPDNTPIRLLSLIQPHIHTKGTDYVLEALPERQTVEGYGGRIALVGGPKEHSTTVIRWAITADNKMIPVEGPLVLRGKSPESKG
jgi:bifunctional ADP-heptose synthase (sugar kinase/adenylyltransferase)